jgi:hypothetical protein
MTKLLNRLNQLDKNIEDAYNKLKQILSITDPSELQIGWSCDNCLWLMRVDETKCRADSQFYCGCFSTYDIDQNTDYLESKFHYDIKTIKRHRDIANTHCLIDTNGNEYKMWIKDPEHFACAFLFQEYK